jgi:glycosyltransferase involved in cell wall biosynthesis
VISKSNAPMRILIAHHQYPEYDKMAGSLRLLEIVRVLREAGHALTFLAYKETAPRYQRILEELGVECVSDAHRALRQSAEAMGGFLKSHDFEAAILVMYNCYNRYAPYIRSALPRCRLIFDTTDLAFVRYGRQAEIEGTPEARAHAEEVRAAEVSAIKDADSVWTVSERERKIVLDLVPGKDAHVVKLIHRVADHRPDFDERQGLVFIGSYGHAPNVDGVRWFMKNVFPLIDSKLPGIGFTIIGQEPPDDFHDYEKRYPGVRVTGYVEDHRAILASSRVGVAPLRFGAGVKGKIAEYFCCGLPCVSTTIGIEGMELVPGRDVLTADTPEGFAEAVVRTYSEADTWRGLSEAGIEYVRRELSVEAVAPQVLAALEAAARLESTKTGSGLSNIVWCIRNPRKIGRWIGLAASTLRREGLGEMMRQILIWLRRPSPS